MTAALVLQVSAPRTREQAVADDLGQADARLGPWLVDESVPPLPDGWRATLPVGSRVVEERRNMGTLRKGDELFEFAVDEADFASPVLGGRLHLVHGRFGARPGEVVLSTHLARVTHLGIGDRLRLRSPAVSVVVSGIAERPAFLRDEFIAGPEGLLDDRNGVAWLVDLPPGRSLPPALATKAITRDVPPAASFGTG